MFAVLRGNFSEGYNFAGNLARGVILIGVPYLDFKSPKLFLKREFYKQNKALTTLNTNKYYPQENFNAYYFR